MRTKGTEGGLQEQNNDCCSALSLNEGVHALPKASEMENGSPGFSVVFARNR